jgi:hypothetical protein
MEVFEVLPGLAEAPVEADEMALFDYNALLEETSCAGCLNERFLEQKIRELDEIDSGRNELYWLTLARLNELTLLCAGNYADNFEFTAAGDLLVNPRLILVHIRNQSKPVRKKRHARLADQFKDAAGSGKEVIQWLKKETLLEIRNEPLAPYLYKRLEKSGYMSQAYLRKTERRMKQVADVIVLLSSLHLPSNHGFHHWLQHRTPSEREFIKSSLCRFDWRTFHDLGRDFYRISRGGGCKSKFLS